MVPNIILFCHSYNKIKLPERAENVKTNGTSSKYQIANIHNPKMKFYFLNTKSQYIFSVNITNMEE